MVWHCMNMIRSNTPALALVKLLIWGGLNGHSMGTKVSLYLRHHNAPKARVDTEGTSTSVDAAKLEWSGLITPFGTGGAGEHHRGR